MNKYTKRAEEYWEATHKPNDYSFLFANNIGATTGTDTLTTDSITWINPS